jgi:hypothetical protein
VFQIDYYIPKLSTFVVAINMLFYPIILLLGYKIIRFIHNHGNVVNNHKFQKQINLTLIIQALIPLCLTGIPASISYVLSLTVGERPQSFTAFTFMLRTMIPLLNPFVAFIFIRSLRNYIYSLFFNSVVNSTTVVNVVTKQTIR